jgi:hypothetical protein
VTRYKLSWTSFSAGPKATRSGLPSLGSMASARRTPSSSPFERGWPSSRCALFCTKSGWWPSDAARARTSRDSLSYPRQQRGMPPSTVGVCAQPQSTAELWTARLGADRRWSSLSGPCGSPARCPPRCPHTHSQASTVKKGGGSAQRTTAVAHEGFLSRSQLSNASEQTCNVFGTDIRDRHRTCQQRLGSSNDSVMRLVPEHSKPHLGVPLPYSATGAFVNFVE